MKLLFFKKILYSLLVLTALTSAGYAQNQDKHQMPVQPTEVLGENDRLPFMQTENAAANNEPSSGGLLIRTLGAMILIVGLIFFGAWGLKKMGIGNFKSDPGDDAPNLAILSSVSLGSGRTISTVRFGERILLVGSTAQAFTLLADESEIEMPIDKKTRSVAEMLAEESGDSFASELVRAELNFDDRQAKGERIR